MFIAQSCCHSFIIAIVVEAALHAWKIENAVERQRFRLLIIILPILSFPLYQVLNPKRGSLAFRLDALFDITRWLNLEIWQGISVGLMFLVLLSLTTLIFVIQEMVPIIKHALAAREKEAEGEKPAPEPFVSSALAKLPDPKPDIFIIEDDDLVVFVTTGKRPSIFFSTGTISALTEEEIQAAIAHEMAHIERNKNPLLIITFMLRIIHFFNPIALVEFRRIVQEEENICDDYAVALTGKSQALANALRKFHSHPDDAQTTRKDSQTPLKDRLEEYSHAMIIESRIVRLEDNLADRFTRNRFAFVLTIVAILGINYFIV